MVMLFSNMEIYFDESIFILNLGKVLSVKINWENSVVFYLYFLFNFSNSKKRNILKLGMLKFMLKK